jgi:Asp-tRNA(Asn)/Glu-tRNA(Gln) amidotransferase A subunit family amidase
VLENSYLAPHTLCYFICPSEHHARLICRFHYSQSKAALIRYSIAGNFLGLPAITVTVGHDKEGLPIGLQFIGRPWSEATLLHIAFAMQASGNH